MIMKIGVIYSPHFGAGWSTWGDPKSALDQELAQAIENGASIEKLEAIAERNWPEQYQGGLGDAVVEWVDAGTPFRIDEYDGNERLVLISDWQVAE